MCPLYLPLHSVEKSLVWTHDSLHQTAYWQTESNSQCQILKLKFYTGGKEGLQISYRYLPSVPKRHLWPGCFMMRLSSNSATLRQILNDRIYGNQSDCLSRWQIQKTLCTTQESIQKHPVGTAKSRIGD